MRRIRIGSIVSRSDSKEHENKLYYVTGEIGIGKHEDIGGFWQITDWKTEEQDQMIGCFLNVWGIVDKAKGLN